MGEQCTHGALMTLPAATGAQCLKCGSRCFVPRHASLEADLTATRKALAVLASGYMPDEVQEVANRVEPGWFEGFDVCTAEARALLARLDEQYGKVE